MLFYEEIKSDFFHDYDELYIYGAGNWGSICKKILERKGVKINSFIDRDKNKIGNNLDGIIILPLEKLLERDQNAKINVIVAMQQHRDVYLWLADLIKGATYVYSKSRFYKCEERAVLGESEVEDLHVKIKKRRIYIQGSGKYKEDFLYIFQDLDIGDNYEEGIPSELSD